MAQQSWDGYAASDQQWGQTQEQYGEWTWYRQFPSHYLDLAPHPHEQLLALAKENQRLLREIQHMLHVQLKTKSYETVTSEKTSLGASVDIRESESRMSPAPSVRSTRESASLPKPTMEIGETESPSKPLN